MKLVSGNKNLSLTNIAQLTMTPIRQLRYVIDHQLVPDLRLEQHGRGSVRRFSLFDATIVAIAATLLHAGVSATRVREIMEQGYGAKRSRYYDSFWQEYQHCVHCLYFRVNTLSAIVIALDRIVRLLKGESNE